jgi:hypothetical protein
MTIEVSSFYKMAALTLASAIRCVRVCRAWVGSIVNAGLVSFELSFMHADVSVILILCLIAY